MIKDNSISSKILDIVIHTSLIVLLILTIYPILHVFSVSVSSREAFTRGITFYPQDISLNAYRAIIKAGTVPHGLMNSIKYTSIGTIVNLFFTGTMAFALSRKRLAFRSFYTVLVLIPMFFSGGLIPIYLNVNRLGLNNTMWALVIPNAIAVWNLIIMRTFFQRIGIYMFRATLEILI